MRQMSEIVKNQDPLTLTAATTVKHACQCMRNRHVGAVLVTDRDHRLLGIFTGRDAVSRVLAEGKDVTYDMKADRNDPTAVGTSQMADAIIRKLG